MSIAVEDFNRAVGLTDSEDRGVVAVVYDGQSRVHGSVVNVRPDIQ